jgi:hypothetical protein
MRKYELMPCSKCAKEMRVREDYIKKHTGICMSCQKTGNKNALKHGGTRNKERLYGIWIGLKSRRYQRPVQVCDDWINNYESFRNWALNNGYQDHLTIDRINNSEGYSPQNCQWITLEENSAKDKRIYQDYELEYVVGLRGNMTQIEFAKKLGVSRNTVQRVEKRLKNINNGKQRNHISAHSSRG